MSDEAFTVDQAYDRIVSSSSGRLVEPLRTFAVGQAAPGFTFLGAPEAGESPRFGSTNRGAENYIFGGYQAKAERLVIDCVGNRNVVFVGAHVRANGTVKIRGSDNVIYIGAFTTISNIHISQRGDGGTFTIGDRCMISARVFVGNSDEHAIYDLATGARINLDSDVYIDDHVWLGRDVTIGKGSKIGRDTVIGQGSYVTGTLEPNCVYAGVPARKRREGTTWSRGDDASIQAYEASVRFKNETLALAALRARIEPGIG